LQVFFSSIKITDFFEAVNAVSKKVTGKSKTEDRMGKSVYRQNRRRTDPVGWGVFSKGTCRIKNLMPVTTQRSFHWEEISSIQIIKKGVSVKRKHPFFEVFKTQNC
jgi:hypothetical protein